jgi:SHS2 domain-containing protein
MRCAEIAGGTMAADAAGHEPAEHTADLAVRAWAPDLAGLIEQAAGGMLALMVDETPPPVDQLTIVGEGRDPEELLVDCLREVLTLWAVDHRLAVEVQVEDLADGEARCKVLVADEAAGRRAITQEIKAVTYHDLEITRREGRLEVTVVFDV